MQRLGHLCSNKNTNVLLLFWRTLLEFNLNISHYIIQGLFQFTHLFNIFIQVDIIFSLILGDDFYPKEPNYFETKHNEEEFSTKTCDEFRSITKNIHRSEHLSLHNVQVLQNLESFDEHIDATTKKESKL